MVVSLQGLPVTIVPNGTPVTPVGGLPIGNVSPVTDLAAAAAASDTDTVIVNQGGSNLAQTFTAVKTWVKSWIAVADLNDVAWTSYTPTMTMTTVGGTPVTTSVTSAKYKVIGKTCFVELDVSISNVGSGNAGAFVISSPTTMPATGIPGVPGKEIGVSQKSFKALNFTTTQFYIVFDDGTGIIALGNGTRLQMAGMYRVL